MSDEINKTTGLPLIDQETKVKNARKAKIFGFVALTMMSLIGIGIAILTYKFGSTEVYDARIETAKLYDLKWAFMACWIFTFQVVWLNFYPLQFKEVVMNGGNLRANMFIYKLATDGDEGSAIVLYEDGDLGYYNRSNRSIYHFLENCLQIVVAMPFGFFIFPFPAFVVVCFYSLGRILYQTGYTAKGFGGHFLGFFMDRFATYTMLGFLAIGAYKQF